MHHVKGMALFAACAGLLLAGVALAAGARSRPAADPLPQVRAVIVSFAPTVRSLKEFQLRAEAQDVSVAGMGEDAQLEIRSADGSHRLAAVTMRFPVEGHMIVPDEMVCGGISRWSPTPGKMNVQTTFKFSGKQLETLTVPDGAYLAAWTLGGVRRSNVIPFKVDASFDPTNAPVLSLTPLEPEPGATSLRVAITAQRPRESDPAFTRMQLLTPTLVVDGKVTQLGGGGSNPGPLHVGEWTVYLREVPEVRIDGHATVVAKVAGRETAPVVVSAAAPLAAAWDKGTAAVKTDR